MKINRFGLILSTPLLCLVAGASFAVQPGAAPSTHPAFVADAKSPVPTPASRKLQPSEKIKTVNINKASKSQIKTTLGVTDEDAAKVIAGRPYTGKADLATRGIFTEGFYLTIRKRVVVG